MEINFINNSGETEWDDYEVCSSLVKKNIKRCWILIRK